LDAPAGTRAQRHQTLVHEQSPFNAFTGEPLLPVVIPALTQNLGTTSGWQLFPQLTVIPQNPVLCASS
jgi:hypothetical protein